VASKLFPCRPVCEGNFICDKRCSQVENVRYRPELEAVKKEPVAMVGMINREGELEMARSVGCGLAGVMLALRLEETSWAREVEIDVVRGGENLDIR
jgi:hypothetical protein